MGKYIVSGLLVLGIAFGVLYTLEKGGRSSTQVFSKMIQQQFASASVAVVNNKKITNADLETGIEQFSQIAAAQGADMSSPETMNEVRSQALDVLINTELLKQTAVGRGIEITDEVIETRLVEITEENGGEEVLAERMASLGIDNARFRKDVKDELVIQELLDSLFVDQPIEVTEEELVSFYDEMGGEGAGLPPFEDIRGKIKIEIVRTKEQEIIDNFLADLKAEADIKII
jgi:peptidyl-prolyl cis-trans isomerase SurA